MTVLVGGAIALMVLCLIASFVLSLSEAALLAVSRHELQRAARRGDRSAQLVLEITQRADFVSVVIVGATVMNMTIANLMTQVVHFYGGTDSGTTSALVHGVTLAGILVLAELWPKTYGALRAAPSARAVARTMAWLIRVLAPVVVVMEWISGGLMRAVGVQPRRHRRFITSDEIRAAADIGEEEGVFHPEEGQMLDNVIELGQRTVRDIMVPRVDIVAAPQEMSVHDFVELAVETGYSRIPVYAENIDHIVGVVYVTDVLLQLSRGNSEVRLRDLARPPLLAPESKRLDQMLAELRQKKVHMAIIVDEFGGTEGLVTIEDILEELVGEIEDEHDPPEQDIELVNEREAIASGKTRLEEIAEVLGIDLSHEEHETVGGLLAGLAGRVPQEGEVLTADGVRFIIEAGSDQYIERVRVVAPGGQEEES